MASFSCIEIVAVCSKFHYGDVMMVAIASQITSLVTGEFTAQMASYAENVSIWWRHHVNWNTFPRVLIQFTQHWFRYAEQAISHYLNQWWHSLLTHIWVTRPRWVKEKGRGESDITTITHLTSGGGNDLTVKWYQWYQKSYIYHINNCTPDTTHKNDISFCNFFQIIAISNLPSNAYINLFRSFCLSIHNMALLISNESLMSGSFCLHTVFNNKPTVGQPTELFAITREL